MGVWVVLVAQAFSADAVGPADISAAAASSPRPEVCRPNRRAIGPRLWDRARDPGLERYCLALAKGYATLDDNPRRALAAAVEASRGGSERAAPLVLEGRARAQLGQFDRALERFRKAQQLDARSLEAPAALHAFALASAHEGDLDSALEAYRALVPRASLLDDPWQRQRVYIEAAAVAMGRGPEALDEAIGYLTEARRRGSLPGLGDYVLAMLALALDRQGRSEEAAGVAGAASGPWRLEGVADPDPTPEPRAKRRRVEEPFLPPGEIHALVAVLAERHDPELADDSWRAFLDARDGGPFAGHARRRLGGS